MTNSFPEAAGLQQQVYVNLLNATTFFRLMLQF
jgi:hypothetical protein